MVMAMKKLWKLINRRSLRFSSISFFATIVLARMHPVLAQNTEKTITGNNAMNIALSINTFEIATGLLLAISLVAAIPGMCFMSQHSNKWVALKTSFLGSGIGLFFVLMGGSLIFEHWTPALVAIAWGNVIIFLMVLEFALTL